MSAPVTCAVHKALHRPMLIAKVDRRLFMFSIMMGAATFNVLYSLVAGLTMGLAMYGFARYSTRRDPEMLHIWLTSSSYRARYDPGKHDVFTMEVR